MRSPCAVPVAVVLGEGSRGDRGCPGSASALSHKSVPGRALEGVGLLAQGSKSEISPQPTSDTGSQVGLHVPLIKILKYGSCQKLQTVPEPPDWPLLELCCPVPPPVPLRHPQDLQ